VGFFFSSEYGSRDAPVMFTRRQQREQSMAWGALVLNDFPCFPKASCVVDALYGWRWQPMMHCLHQPLEGLAISSGAAANQAAMQPERMLSMVHL